MAVESSCSPLPEHFPRAHKRRSQPDSGAPRLLQIVAGSIEATAAGMLLHPHNLALQARGVAALFSLSSVTIDHRRAAFPCARWAGRPPCGSAARLRAAPPERLRGRCGSGANDELDNFSKLRI